MGGVRACGANEKELDATHAMLVGSRQAPAVPIPPPTNSTRPGMQAFCGCPPGDGKSYARATPHAWC